ncbi:Uma2 family endonuclease [Oscillochloris sp. ZM17-4]|uniref:Uma2 family endonuclease n=1 Tax=Oscillochloris sp. ZM17-4 TaxID=2866714 RepID=UPI001C73C1A3|nr:Uma2 family endonuclease [Oscillochloris sp. ZM17-4]MBX0328389.1 Uma2 family endonuclease [Oscillochloris sp. ZM17-4]
MERTDIRSRLTVEHWDKLPESKLELIGGKLVAGNSLAGSRCLLWTILQSCGPRAALPFAPVALWRQALTKAFSAPTSLAWPGGWQHWAAQIDHTPLLHPAGTRFSRRHQDTFGLLMIGLYQALREDKQQPLGLSIRRFVLRLGEDGFLPDLQVFRRDRLHRLRENYFDGPADLVIEVALPGHEAQDREMKARLYAAGGVPEYWVIDPAARRTDVLTLRGGSYVVQAPDSDGRYRSTVLPGLTLDPVQLWACLDDWHERRGIEDQIVFVEPTGIAIGPSTRRDERERWAWEWRPYTPPVALKHVPISFEQCIGWCPEAKFELIEGLPHIGGWDGTRKTLGLLLMTFGLEKAVQFLHPREWVAPSWRKRKHAAATPPGAMRGGAGPARPPRCSASASVRNASSYSAIWFARSRSTFGPS